MTLKKCTVDPNHDAADYLFGFHRDGCIKNNIAKTEPRILVTKKSGCLRSLHQGWFRCLAHSDVVSCEGKSSANNLPGTEPRVQLYAEERGDAGVLDFQVISVPPQLLHLIELLPECFVATRKAAKQACQFKDADEDVKVHIMIPIDQISVW